MRLDCQRFSATAIPSSKENILIAERKQVLAAWHRGRRPECCKDGFIGDGNFFSSE